MTAAGPATSTVLSPLPDPRTAVVTGAGGPARIGRVTARALAESGWHVALVDINADGSLRLHRAVLRSAKRGRGHREGQAESSGEVILGLRERERVVGDDDGSVLASFLSVTNLSHDIAIVRSRQTCEDAFTMSASATPHCSTSSTWPNWPRKPASRSNTDPHRRGVVSLHAGAGDNRIELMGDPGYMISDPAWRTVVWKGSEVPAVGAIWTGSPLPDSFWNYGTPAAEEPPAIPEAAAA